MGHILVIEDDERLAALLGELFRAEGWTVAHEPRGDRAVDRVHAERPDLVVLDIGLPGRDGLAVCRDLRPGFRGRILMLTARGEELDEVAGLELGADDYLAKPVSPRRLLAHVRALLRRDRDALRTGDLVVDPGRRVVEVAGEAVPLTTAEFDLLHLLACHVGEVVERDRIYRELLGHEYDGIDRSVDLRVSRLRRAIGDDPRMPRFIKTVRGVGYLLARL